MNRPLIYIAGPISKGDLAENINRATDAFFELLAAGFAPICPHWSCFAGGVKRSVWGTYYAIAETLPNGSDYQEWLQVDLALIERCDAIVRIPDDSPGADLEVEHAESLGLPVFESIAEAVAWLENERKTAAVVPSEPTLHDLGGES